MKGNLLAKMTRFRAYQLGNAGSSFSYFDGTYFTLIEARLTDLNRPRIDRELEICGAKRVYCLHITSWDADHCKERDLEEILERYRPVKIEYPGYPPGSDTARKCLVMTQRYLVRQLAAGVTTTIQSIDPPYIKGLTPAAALGYQDVVYHPKYISPKSNDNSTVKLFRTGSFNVASLGDVEDPMIGSLLRNDNLFSSEVDVLILAHHGADNGLITGKFLSMVRPTIAVCSSNYDNQFDHPREEIRRLLREHKIDLYTTKTGDVAVQSTGMHTHQYKLINLKADSTEISSTAEFVSKKSAVLRLNMDTIKNVYGVTSRPYPR